MSVLVFFVYEIEYFTYHISFIYISYYYKVIRYEIS